MKRRRNRGFAMLVAVGMVALVGAVVLAMTHLLAAEIRQTAAVQTEAQLDQLLLAGAAIAAEKGTGEHEIELPEALQQQGMALSISTVQAGEDRVAQITATVEHESAMQTIRLQLRGDGWQVVEATRH